jgi:hypothetical protein
MNGLRMLNSEGRRAFNLRLLLLWLAAALLPSLIVALPLGGIVRDTLDFSAHTKILAQRLNLDALRSLAMHYQGSQGAIQSNVGFAWMCTLLTAPLLNAWAAMIFAGQHASMQRFFIAGLLDYGRWFWLHLSALMIYLMGFGLAALVASYVSDRADEYIDVRVFQQYQHLSWLCAFLIVVMTHFIVEVCRAELLLDQSLRWPPEAFFRAFKRGGKRKRFGGYLAVSATGIALVMLFLLLRLRFSGSGILASITTLGFAQCAVVALAWMRIARLFILAALARNPVATPRG